MANPAPTGDPLPRRTAAAVFALSLASFVVMVDSTVVQVMLPALMAELGAGLAGVLWVANGFTLVYGVLLLPAARLGDVHGRRNVLVVGLAVFLVGSLVCGAAPALPPLVLGRVVQAVGGALIVPQVLGMIALAVPGHRRGLAFGFVSASMALAAVVGPVLGGAVVSFAGWRWVFLANAPGCALAVAAVLWASPGREPRHGRELDAVGTLLAMGGLGAVVYGCVAAGRSAGGAVPAAVGAVLLVVFVLWERDRPEALVPVRLFGVRAFSVALWLGVLQFVLMSGLMLVVALEVQAVRGGTAFETGLALLPMAVLAGVASPFAGHATDRWGGRPVITCGFLAVGTGVAWAAAVPSLVGPLAVVGLGVGLLMGPISTEVVRDLPERLVNTGSGVLATGRQVAGALGVAVVGAVLQTAAAAGGGVDPVRFAAAERVALVLLGVLAAVGAVGAWFLPGRSGREDRAVVPGRAVGSG
ncbi:DHA2 family efflux MFS transporter permease subunit [Saccharothrix syringae]|uniref:DHA2 family efflux MFS transporter permease subunit n=1 Tax=Saccharothrix syringae TaxID=103733 RepID=A0A5Q0GWN4_SACSY|nr:DHA2 family efflux MFS transporter permease subunit [Saccharothrix syringae]QFZ18303.1 DHA2 family efflux MFS transporter permease subunit [Saccharothrix syringae]